MIFTSSFNISTIDNEALNSSINSVFLLCSVYKESVIERLKIFIFMAGNSFKELIVIESKRISPLLLSLSVFSILALSSSLWFSK